MERQFEKVGAGIRVDGMEIGLIRDKLSIRLKGNSTSAVGFVSSVAGEGTTSVLLAVARATLMEEKKVLVVDAGRNGTLSAMLGAEGKKWTKDHPGLAEGAGHMVCETPHPGLSLLPLCGRTDRLSAGYDWKALIHSLKAEWDAVFFDLPAVMNSTLAAGIASDLDGLVMVVSAHTTRKEVLLKAAGELRQFGGGTLLGTVLNRRKFFIPQMLYRFI